MSAINTLISLIILDKYIVIKMLLATHLISPSQFHHDDFCFQDNNEEEFNYIGLDCSP